MLFRSLLGSQFDEKFGILQAPAAFLGDLAFYRHECALRSCPVSVAFMDLDDFKKLNTVHKESVVDREILPRLMFAIEAHSFSHGHAYREGGDEYTLLLPNMTEQQANSLLTQLLFKLYRLDFAPFPIGSRITASIGFVTATPDCTLTDSQLVGAANTAEKYAKGEGGRRIATFVEGFAGAMKVTDTLP